jgi:hypothetical protein
METHWRLEVYLHYSWPRHLKKMSGQLHAPSVLPWTSRLILRCTGLLVNSCRCEIIIKYLRILYTKRLKFPDVACYRETDARAGGNSYFYFRPKSCGSEQGRMFAVSCCNIETTDALLCRYLILAKTSWNKIHYIVHSSSLNTNLASTAGSSTQWGTETLN